MAAKIVLASKRFQRAYPEFLYKYHGLERTFRDFLTFRAKTRPDESFNAKDGRIGGTKFWRCHLVHGKAILIYQLVGSELRLVDLDDHNIVESGSNHIMRTYAKSLTPEDYYKFDVDAPGKPKQESDMSGQQQDATITEDRPVEAPHEPRSEAPASPNPLWDDKTIDYMRDQQLLYVPRPTKPMIMIRLTKEIIAPKGDVLAIDPVNQTIYVLTAGEVDAHFQPANKAATTLGDAIAAIVPVHFAASAQPEAAPRAPVARPGTAPRAPAAHPGAAPRSAQAKAKAKGKRQPVAPQMGRLLLTMVYVSTVKKTPKLDTATIREYMPESDRKIVSVLMSDAQNKGFVQKAGHKPAGATGGRFWYSLTTKGQDVSRTLGDEPFSRKGIPSVFPLSPKAAK